MKDRNGHDYETLLVFQSSDLKLWQTKLVPQLFDEVREYVLSHNQPADETGKHQVFRGQDLIEIVREWPKLSPAYPPKLQPATLDDV